MASDRTQVKCPSCKKPVDFGRVFCPLCGGAMNDGNKQPKAIRNTGRSSNSQSGGSILGAIFRTLLTIFLIVVIILLLWPYESTSKIGQRAEAQALRTKINAMEKAMKAERPFKQILSEEEVNAHLKLIVNKQPAAASAATPVVEEISVDLLPDNKLVAYTRTRIWKLVLTHRLEMIPDVREGGFSPEITSAHLGHLPMMSVMRMPVVNKFKKTLTNLKQEKALLENLDRIQVREDQVAILIQ